MGKTKSKNAKPNLQKFADWGDRLRRAYDKASRRKARAGSTIPRKEPMNAFRFAAYQYYDDLRSNGLLGDLRTYVEERDGARWSGYDDHCVRWVIRLAREGGGEKPAHDSDTAYKWRRRDSRIAAELKLAAINKVKPGLLIGFLYEAGKTTKIESDARNGKRYRWAKAYQR